MVIFEFNEDNVYETYFIRILYAIILFYNHMIDRKTILILLLTEKCIFRSICGQ